MKIVTIHLGFPGKSATNPNAIRRPVSTWYPNHPVVAWWPLRLVPGRDGRELPADDALGHGLDAVVDKKGFQLCFEFLFQNLPLGFHGALLSLAFHVIEGDPLVIDHLVFFQVLELQAGLLVYLCHSFLSLFLNRTANSYS